MNTWIALAAMLVLLVLLISMKFKRAKATSDESWPYQQRCIMTDREQALYHLLREALPDCIVFTQMHLSQVIEVKRHTKDSKNWLTKIHQARADFVVCKPDFSVLAVIDVDDSFQSDVKQSAREAEKNKALKAAGIKVIRVRDLPTVTSICKKFGRESSSRAKPQSKFSGTTLAGIEVEELDSHPRAIEASSKFMRVQGSE